MFPRHISRLEIGHYSGAPGRRYFRYQSRNAALMAAHVAAKFSRYVRPSDTVVDFGCGGGYVLSALSCTRRLGVEINPAARKAAQANGVTCCESLDGIDDSIADVAIAHHSLEHVACPLEVLVDLRCKLKPAGLLVLVAPIDDWRVQRDYERNNLNHHLYTWTPLLLGNLLAEAGFDITTLGMSIGVNGWFGTFPKVCPVLPRALSGLLLAMWARIRKTREIRAVIRTHPADSLSEVSLG